MFGCAVFPGGGEPYVRYGLSDGQIAWRAIAPCRYMGSSFESLTWIDRGIIDASRGEIAAPDYTLPPPVDVVGVIRPDEADDGDPVARMSIGFLSGSMIAVEQESPAPSGVTPSPLPTQISNNHLGYAITWYGLAAALVGVYVAMLLGDRRPSRAA